MTQPGAMQAALPWLHSDAHLLAVYKPAGLLVHRSALDRHAQTDVISLLRAQVAAPLWPVHRLDKGTSGVLVLARDVESARRLGAAFAMPGTVGKHYLALVRGWPPERGQIDQPLARDPELPSAGQALLAASTAWQVLARLNLPLASHPDHPDTRLALVQVQPLSGRRHQIRRHFKHLAHPLIGDATHGKGPLNRAIAAHIGHTRLWLHALQLRLPHPADGRMVTLRAEPGPEWQRWQQAAADGSGRDA